MRWNVGLERLDLLHQGVGQAVAGDVGNAGNVVDRLLGIELGALAADLVEDVDEVRLDVEQAELEHGEQPHRPRADNENVGFNGLTHYATALYFVALVLSPASDWPAYSAVPPLAAA